MTLLIALKGGRIITITKGVIEGGTILIENGKIKAVGKEVTIPSGTEVIDVTGKVVMPGIVDPHTHAGISMEEVGWEGRDHNEITDPVTPHLRALDAIKPEDHGFQEAREYGITTACVVPGSANPIGGLGAIVKCYGNTVEEMLIKEPFCLKMAFGENPRSVYGQGMKKAPYTRMAVAGLIREWLTKAQNYMKKKEAAKKKPEDWEKFEKDIKLEVLEKLLRKELVAYPHAHTSYDIMTAIRLSEEFGYKMILQHSTEAHLVANELAKRDIWAVCGPLLTARYKVELRHRTPQTPAILYKAGVKVAFTVDHPVLPPKMLPISAAVAVREGLPEEEALKALTINPAQFLGLDHRIGSIEEGKDADLVVMTGHPLDVMRSKVEMTFIDGKIVYETKS